MSELEPSILASLLGCGVGVDQLTFVEDDPFVEVVCLEFVLHLVVSGDLFVEFVHGVPPVEAGGRGLVCDV